jgi:hypothetical protein
MPYKRWVNLDKDFLVEVKEDELKDEDYNEAMKSLENMNKIHMTVSVKKKGYCITAQDYGSHIVLGQVS